MAIGGSIESITIDGREFAVAADSEANRKLGGFDNEVEANGDGSARVIKTRAPWGLDGIAVVIDDSNEDAEFLQALADSGRFAPVVITYASGDAYQGTGQITGELQHGSKSTTATLNLKGSGKLTKQ